MEAAALAGLAMCALQNKNIEEAQELVDVIKKSHKDDLENSHVKKVCSSETPPTQSFQTLKNCGRYSGLFILILVW